MGYENKRLGLTRPELAPLQTTIDIASRLIIPVVNRQANTLSGNSLEREAAKRVAEIVDVLTLKRNTDLLNRVIFNKKNIERFKELEQEYIEKGFSQEQIQDARSCQNFTLWKLFQISQGLRNMREEIGLALLPKDIKDARVFQDNWALFIRGSGHLAGPPWEPDVFRPAYSHVDVGDGIPYEGDKLEISLTYLSFHPISNSATTINVFSAPLLTIGYDGKPTINVITGQNKRFNYYNSDNDHLFGQIMPVKSPLRYQWFGK